MFTALGRKGWPALRRLPLYQGAEGACGLKQLVEAALLRPPARTVRLAGGGEPVGDHDADCGQALDPLHEH